MNWRPWIIAAMTFAMVTVNTALLWFEEIEPPEGSKGTTDVVRDPLLAMRFNPGQRKSNFKSMFGGNERLAAPATDGSSAPITGSSQPAGVPSPSGPRSTG